jgi:hypothetical protein
VWRCSISTQVGLHRNIEEVTSLMVHMRRRVTLVVQLERRGSFNATIHIVASLLNLVHFKWHYQHNDIFTSVFFCATYSAIAFRTTHLVVVFYATHSVVLACTVPPSVLDGTQFYTDDTILCGSSHALCSYNAALP